MVVVVAAVVVVRMLMLCAVSYYGATCINVYVRRMNSSQEDALRPCCMPAYVERSGAKRQASGLEPFAYYYGRVQLTRG